MNQAKSWQAWFGFLGIVALVVLVALPILTYPMGRDQGMYANIGRTILAGDTPFVDMWDIKPPPIYYIYALGIQLFGVTTQAIRALDLVCVPIGMLGLFLLGTRIHSHRVGLLAAVLYGAFYFNDGFQNLSQSDSLATIVAIWAAYTTVVASKSASRIALSASLAAGALSGLLLWFKPQQYALIVAAFVLYQIANRLQDKTIRILLPDAISFALGGLLTGGSLLVYFWSQGMVQEILIVAEGTAAYNAQGYDWNAFISNMRQGLWFRWQVWHLLFVLSGAWLLHRGWSLTQRIPIQREALLLSLWLVSGIGFAFVQAKGFDTHWFPMLPPLALMSAFVLDGMLHFIERIVEGQSVVLLAIVVLLILLIPTITTWGRAWHYISGTETQSAYWDGFQANDLKPEESLAVAQFLQERVQAGDTLYIWGFRPEVYYMANLRPATRYQAHFPLVAPWYPIEWQQENVDILWAALPPYALILEDDFMPWVTDFDADSHTLLQDYTELNNWLIANYQRDDEIGDFIIWRRTSP